MISKSENLVEDIAYDIYNNNYFNQLNKKIIQLYTTFIKNSFFPFSISYLFTLNTKYIS
jgi:hypothetical protein